MGYLFEKAFVKYKNGLILFHTNTQSEKYVYVISAWVMFTIFLRRGP